MNYLVIGPESSGTHYLKDLLGMNIRDGDTVTHRSMPLTFVEGDPRSPGHIGPPREVWPDVEGVCRTLGPEVTVVVCARHPDATVRGQIRAGWSTSREQAREKRRQAWKLLGAWMSTTEHPFVVSTYSSLKSRGGRRALLETLGLELTNDKEFVDGNAKYWRDSGVDVSRGAPVVGPPS